MSQHKGKIAGIIVILLIIFYAIAVYWSTEPSRFDVVESAKEQAQLRNETMVTGYITTSTLITVANTLLDKPGGYLSNDVIPPSIIMDDMPAWEYGALEMVRDLSLSMRKDFSRSQSQSTEHEALKKAQPQFNISSEAWAWGHISSMNNQIAAATEQQSSVAETVVGNIENMYESFSATSIAVEEIGEVASQLDGNANLIKDATSKFIV